MYALAKRMGSLSAVTVKTSGTSSSTDEAPMIEPVPTSQILCPWRDSSTRPSWIQYTLPGLSPSR